MRPDILNPIFAEIDALKGVGSALARPLERLGLRRAVDVAFHLPTGMVERKRGGIINVAAEISGAYDMAWVDGKLSRLMETLGEVLDQARREDKATNRVADAIARKRIGR